jgi:hypothetical protein
VLRCTWLPAYLTSDASAWVFAGNVAFAILVTVVLVAGWLPLTALGVVSTIAFTIATVGFAYAQYLGVRRLA